MRRPARILLLFPAALLAEEAVPLPVPEPAPAVAPSLAPTGEMLEAAGKHLLRVIPETDLPVGAILQVYLNRDQFTTSGEPSQRLVQSKRFSLVEDRAKPLELPLDRLLPPAVYEVVVVCDGQRQYPAVLAKLGGLQEIRRSFRLQVGSDEEVALEHEWGESRVTGVLRRCDAVAAGLASQTPETWPGFWAEQSERLGWMADRLGRVGESSPVPEVWFPKSEELLKKFCGDLKLAGDGAPGPLSLPAGLQEVRDRSNRLYAAEFTARTLQDLHHWLRFVHQEYWLNRIHKRLSPAQWEAFRADQRRRLGAIESNYSGYAGSEDPVRKGIARHFPPLVSEAAAALRRLQDSYDQDLKEGRWKPGAGSGEIEHGFQGLLRKAGFQVQPLQAPRPE